MALSESPAPHARTVDDLEVLRRAVSRVRDQGADVDALAERLLARLDAVGWHGRAADAMRERVVRRSRQLHRAADRHALAADLLGEHVAAVARAHDEIARRASRADARVAEARERVARLADLAERPLAADLAPDPADAALLAFDPPPPGHPAWLEVDLPGLAG